MRKSRVTNSPKKDALASEKAYRAIKDMILNHRFKPGLRINVEGLARELGISRTPVWEAIRRLEQERLIRKIPNRGVFMAENSFDRLLGQAHVRGTLDNLAGRLACERVNKRLLERLAQCLVDQLQAIETADLSAYSTADLRFHRLIYEASDNRYLKDLFESIVLQMLTIPRHLRILSRLPSVYETHQEALEGLANRDPDRVERALTRHTKIITDHLEDKMKAEAERKKKVSYMREHFSYGLLSTQRRRKPEGAVSPELKTKRS